MISSTCLIKDTIGRGHSLSVGKMGSNSPFMNLLMNCQEYWYSTWLKQREEDMSIKSSYMESEETEWRDIHTGRDVCQISHIGGPHTNRHPLLPCNVRHLCILPGQYRKEFQRILSECRW